MKTKTIQTYSFNELSLEAKQNAIKDERNNPYGLTYGEWWDSVEWDWKERLEKEGYKEITISFSGFGSQGDGANFTATMDIQKWLEVAGKKTKYRSLYNFAKQYDIPTKLYRQSHQYEHEYVVNIDTERDYDMTDKQLDQLDEVEQLILEEARIYMKELYRDLEREYDNLTSSSYIETYLSDEVCEYREYTKDGELI